MVKSIIVLNRRSIRLQSHNYSGQGIYFVTLKTEFNRHLFGHIQSGKMSLNDYGQIVKEEWEKTAVMRSGIVIDEYVIMPDHFHSIIIIDPDRSDLRSPLNMQSPVNPQLPLNMQPIPNPCPQNAPQSPQYRLTPTGGRVLPQSCSLGAILSGFKSAVTRQINQIRQTNEPQIWERNYFERIIRDFNQLSNTRDYIRNNPSKWHQ